MGGMEPRRLRRLILERSFAARVGHIGSALSVADILTFYQEAGAQMFVKANLLERLRYKFEDEPLAVKLREVFGANTQFGSDKLQTLLLLVMRNASTDSPW